MRTPSSTLLANVLDPGTPSDIRYASERSLIGRWEKRTDLPLLVDLLRSERDRERLYGARLLGEMRTVDVLLPSVLPLADDVLPSCRLAFISYVSESGDYGAEIAEALARLFSDLELRVRQQVILWAVRAPAPVFADFSERLDAGAGLSPLPPSRSNRLVRLYRDLRQADLVRRTRAITIINRLRNGDRVEALEHEIAGEDSLLWTWLAIAQKRNASTRPSAGE